MILVTGTKRSGTSMWMQILKGAGVSVIGDPFLAEWEESIRDANPHGFYESTLRQGIFYATNPDPRTGSFLHPRDTRHHAVKVFIPGLIRTDFAFLHRVVASMRDWRDYGPSLQRLYAMEDEHLAKKGPAAVEMARKRRSKLPPHVEWLMENYDLIRDFSARRFPIRLHTYERLLEDPERILTSVFGWLEIGDVAGGIAAIDPKVRTQRQGPVPEGVEPAHVEVFDAFHATIHEEKPLPRTLIDRLNEVHHELREAHGGLSRERGREEAEDSSEAEAGP